MEHLEKIRVSHVFEAATRQMLRHMMPVFKHFPALRARHVWRLSAFVP